MPCMSHTEHLPDSPILTRAQLFLNCFLFSPRKFFLPEATSTMTNTHETLISHFISYYSVFFLFPYFFLSDRSSGRVLRNFSFLPWDSYLSKSLRNAAICLGSGPPYLFLGSLPVSQILDLWIECEALARKEKKGLGFVVLQTRVYVNVHSRCCLSLL